MKIAVVRLQPQRCFHVWDRSVEFGLPTQHSAKVHVRFRIVWIELDRGLVLLDRFFQFAFLLQGRAVIKMRFRTVRHIRNDPRHPLHLGNGKMRLPKPQCAEWHHEYADPFQAVPCPARKQAAKRHISGSTSEPERLTCRALPNLPDKSVIIKMQQRGSGYQAGENPFNGIHSEMRIDEGN